MAKSQTIRDTDLRPVVGILAGAARIEKISVKRGYVASQVARLVGAAGWAWAIASSDEDGDGLGNWRVYDHDGAIPPLPDPAELVPACHAPRTVVINGAASVLFSIAPIKSGLSCYAFAPSEDKTFTDLHRLLCHLVFANVGWLHKAQDVRADSFSALSPRLQKVLFGLLGGATRKQIACDLGLSEHTVHDYTKDLYRRLNVNSAGELMAMFVKRNASMRQASEPRANAAVPVNEEPRQ